MKSCFASLLLLGMASSVVAQQGGTPSQTTPASQDTVPKIVKHTQLVYVPVVVNDKHGQHVRGLSKDAFVIEQDGKPQSVAIFEEVGKTVSYERAKPLAPDVIENFAVNDAQARKTIILILDTLNTPFMDQARTKRALINYVHRVMRPDQPLALMVLSRNGLHQIHSVTADPNILIDAVNGVQQHYTRAESLTDPDFGIPGPTVDAYSSTADQEMAAMVQYLNDVEAHFYQREAARTTVEALEQLAGCFTGIPGRKSVIWATTGFPMMFNDPNSINGLDADFLDKYDRAWKRLNDANMAIYPIDLAGVQVTFPTASTRNAVPFSMQGRGGSMMGSRSPNAPRFDLRAQQHDMLQSFADATGGKAFFNSNDIGDSLSKAADEADAYYLLGYYLHDEEKPGWHKLKVHVNGPHGEIRARNGFFVGAQKVSSEKDRLAELITAVRAPADYTGLHFGIRLPSSSGVAPAKAAVPDKRVEKIHFSFPPGTLRVDPDQNNLVQVDLLVVALKPGDTRASAQALRAVHFNFKPEDLKRALTGGIGFDDQLEVAPGTYEMRVAVRDLNSGSMGSLRTKLVVP